MRWSSPEAPRRSPPPTRPRRRTTTRSGTRSTRRSDRACRPGLEALERAPQTNEIRRSAILLPALWWVLAQTGDRPIALSELGASAGLNLMLDRFAIETPDGRAGPDGSPVRLRPEWRAPPPPARALRVVDRAGVDRHPIDAGDPADALRLMSYLWPDQPDRMAMTRGAIGMGPARPDEGDAAPWLKARLTSRPGDCLHVVYTTVAWQYFPKETQEACTRRSKPRGPSRPPRRPWSISPSRPTDAATVGRLSRAALASCAGARIPCTCRFSRPLGRLARLAIALPRRPASVGAGEKSERTGGILDAVRDGYVH
jgi:hypothetical protein